MQDRTENNKKTEVFSLSRHNIIRQLTCEEEPRDLEPCQTTSRVFSFNRLALSW